MGNEENDQLKRQNLSAYESGSNNAKLKPLNTLMATSSAGRTGPPDIVGRAFLFNRVKSNRSFEKREREESE